MAGWLIALVGAIYLVCAINLARKGDLAMAIVFLGYSFSNVGLYFAVDR